MAKLSERHVRERFNGEKTRTLTTIPQHLEPIITIQVMNSSSSTDEEYIFVSQWSKSCSHLDVVVWIVSCVHADDCRRRATIRKHPDENQISVVNPIELFVEFCFQAALLEHLYTARCHRKVWVEFVRHEFGGLDVGYWGFGGCWVGCYFDFVAECCPMCSLISINTAFVEI